MKPDQELTIDIAGVVLYRRGACLPTCGCPRIELKLVRTERQEWLRARTRYRLLCGACGRWGAKFVPHRFIEEEE